MIHPKYGPFDTDLDNYYWPTFSLCLDPKIFTGGNTSVRLSTRAATFGPN